MVQNHSVVFQSDAAILNIGQLPAMGNVKEVSQKYKVKSATNVNWTPVGLHYVLLRLIVDLTCLVIFISGLMLYHFKVLYFSCY